jgi:N-acetylmuramic acid 6-phosphate (MurNAc-6-P) etherase
MMIRVIYRGASGFHVMDEEFDDEDEADRTAAQLRARGFTDVEVVIGLAAADETARAMVAVPLPVAGRAGYGRWDQAAAR